MRIRPKHFRLDPTNHMAKGLVFAGLGWGHGATRMFDSSLRRNNGALTNMDPASDWVFVPELGRWGLEFDGDSTEGVNCGLATFSQGLRECSISTWLRPHLADLYAQVVSKWTYLRCQRHTSDRLQFWVNSQALYSSNNIWVDDEWIHLVFTYNADGDGKGIYVNGDLDATDTTPQTETLNTDTDGVWLGEHPDGGGATDYAGLLSDPLVYNRALTPTEIADLADPHNVSLSGMLDWGRTRKRYFLPTSSSIIPHVMHYRRLMST